MIAVSVIIPVYNAESHLEECIQSVLKQTMNNIEIICVNDGSVDQSLQILRKLQESDTRIEIIDKSNYFVSSYFTISILESSDKSVAIFSTNSYELLVYSIFTKEFSFIDVSLNILS